MGGAVGDCLLGAPPPLGLVDTEVGEREQPCRSGKHELGEVGWAAAADRRDGLADLERVSDRAPERLVHVG